MKALAICFWVLVPLDRLTVVLDWSAVDISARQYAHISQKSPIFSQKSPTFSPKSPIFFAVDMRARPVLHSE